MFIKLIFASAFLLLAIAAALFYIHFGGTSNLLVVRLDSVRGINFISTAWEVWGVLAVVSVINLINLLLALALLKRERIFAFLLPLTSVFVNLLILIYVSNIITIN